MADFDEILDKINKATLRFAQSMPAAQRSMYNEILDAAQRLDVKDGKIDISAKNLKAINNIKNKLLKVIVTDEYKDKVKEYLKTFNEVTQLQNQYWKGIEANFKPPKLLQALKEITVTDTADKLLEAGIGVNIGDKVTDILRQNITGGGSYANLTEQLRQHILTTPESSGALEKYARQITTDAINQYNGQYTQVVTNDLGYEWFKYDNTDIETTRPFCDAMTDIKYFHISEVPAILRADGLTYVDKKGERVNVRLYSKTGLPHGMIPGTDASNFFVRRGGYNCGHQIRPVNASQVPKEIKDRVVNTPAYIQWQAKNTEEPKPIPKPKESVSQVRKDILSGNSSKALSRLKESGYDIHDDLFDYLPSEVTVVYEANSSTGSHYQNGFDRIWISGKDRDHSEYYKKFVVAHEIGHAIHYKNNLIKREVYGISKAVIDKRISDVKLRMNRGILKDKVSIHNKLLELRREAFNKNDYSAADQIVELADILGSLTGGQYGWGHTKSYYKLETVSEMELFANGVSLLKNNNPYLEKVPQEFRSAINDLKNTLADILKSIKQTR